MKPVLLLDNYDSFTYNLCALVQQVTGRRPAVVRNDQITLKTVAAFDKLLLSPGPGLPESAGIMMDLIRTFTVEKSILGICLGHQAIALSFGAVLQQLEKVQHGVTAEVRQIGNDYLFEGLEERFTTGRYHSWTVDPGSIPDCLEVTATTDTGVIMALSHRKHDLKGLQFHPESVLTPQGERILTNWLLR